MKYLAVDVGLRRSGFAYADSTDGILFSLETFAHTTQQELFSEIQRLVREKQVDEVVLGNPLLPSGEPGAQAALVSALAGELSEASITHHLCDERYTSAQGQDIDKDAAASCKILSVWLDINK